MFMGCDMCGKVGQLFVVEVEGTDMEVCDSCSKFGKVKKRLMTSHDNKIKEKNRQVVLKNIEPKREIVFIIVDDYSSKIKNARERMNLKQEDVAKKIAEKESLLQNIESGKFEPNIELARKLEKFFNISIVEQHEEIHKPISKSNDNVLTLGDMIKFKK